MRRLLACLIAAIAAPCAPGAVYFVNATGGNDSRTTTQAQNPATPWLTINHARSQAAPGDVVRVQAGTYNERVTVAIDGNSSAWITFIGDGMPVCRGFSLNGADYIRIIGFEITHTSSTWSRGIDIDGTCSNLLIEGNYVHHTYNEGAAIGQRSGTASYVTIRNNRIDYISYVPGVYTAGNGTGIGSYPNGAHHWLVEGNVLTRCGDFTTIYGDHHIIRGNAMTDYADAYWTGTPLHSDMFQPGSDGQDCGTNFHCIEANWMGDSTGADSHFLLLQDTVGAGDSDIIGRGNVGFNFGSGLIGVISTDNVLTYQNSFHDVTNVSTGAVANFYGANPSTGNLLQNTIISNDNGTTDAIQVGSGSSLTQDHNIGYLAGSESGYLSTSDPQFVAPGSGTRNFRLQATSPAINAGTHITTVTSADGSGTSFTVAEPNRLIDGWGIADGDLITTGGTTVRITSISGSTVTVSASVTWTSGQPVYWLTDTTPDIGALPYGSQPLTAATLSQAGTSWTVSVDGATRGVWFYVDGIPTAWVAAVPYTTTIPSGTVSARAFALHAQATPVVEAAPAAAATGYQVLAP